MADELNLQPSSDKAWLLVKSPVSAFVCWTWNRPKSEAFEAGAYEPGVLVRLSSCDDKSLITEAEAPWNSGKTYLKPPAEGASCLAAVYARNKDGVLEKLLESNAAAVPVSGPRGGVSSGYASAEFIRRVE
jgi:hypothetical protein